MTTPDDEARLKDITERAYFAAAVTVEDVRFLLSAMAKQGARLLKYRERIRELRADVDKTDCAISIEAESYAFAYTFIATQVRCAAEALATQDEETGT